MNFTKNTTIRTDS